MSKGIILGPPPEFGSDGASPPVSSEPVIVATWWLLIDAARSELIHVEATPATGLFASPSNRLIDAALDHMREWVAQRGTRGRRQETTPSELKRRFLIYSQLWRRNDPITQLPPGVTSETSYTVTTGIEQSRSRELSQSLGLKTTGSPLDLSASLSSNFQLRLTLKAEETRSSTLRLVNDGSDRYRRFAIWSVVHRLEVIAFEEGPLLLGSPPFASAEVVVSDSANLTSVDVQRPA